MKVLFIEDEVKFQKTFAEFFSKEDLEVVSAYDGISGLRLAEEHLPDIIVLDLILPKKDGFQVLAEIKKNPLLQAIPVIILTNLEGVEDIEKAVSLGASSYLVKANYSMSEILNEIRKALILKEN